MSTVTGPHGSPAYIGENNLAKDKYHRPDRLLQNPDAIVIGSGIGGLGIASLLAQRKKMRVLVLEGAPIPGGSCRCYEWDGYEFNTGIDSIGDMDPSVGLGFYRPTIDYMTGGQLQWAKMPEVHEVVRFGEDVYEWYSSPEKNIAWVEERFPGEGHKAQKYYDLEARIMQFAPAMGVTKVLPEALPEAVRDRIYRTIGGPWVEYLQRKTTDVLRHEIGFSDRLASIFSYIYGYHGATPARSPFAFHAATMFHYRWGAYYPVGGPAQIIECIVPIVERAGGQVAVRSSVEEIIVEGNTAVGVKLASGETIRAPLVISDVGAYGTFMDLLPRGVSERHGYVERFNQVGPSVAHLYLFLGYDEAIDLPKQIFWELPTYDIEDFDAGFKQRMEFEECFGGYLLSPSARDPVFGQRYPGKSTIIALNEAPFEWVERARRDPAFREQMEGDITKYLTRAVHAHMPQLRDKTPAFSRAGMPFGCNPRAWKSCSLGVEPSAERFLTHTHWLRPKTKISNLYLTGHDAFAMGFSSAMLAARLCYATITNNWLFALKKNIGRFP